MDGKARCGDLCKWLPDYLAEECSDERDLSSAWQSYLCTNCDPLPSIGEGSCIFRHVSVEYNKIPSYIEPAPPHITEEHFQFLKYKRALLIPNSKVRQEIWTGYWKYAYPCIPVLDQIEMTKSMKGRGQKIGMLLYQCIMLVGQLFLVAHEGPQSKFEDTKDLFERAQYLYDFGWETRPLIILQSLILMTFFPQKINEPKDQTQLIGNAVSIAYKMGLHRDPTLFESVSSVRHLRKRLWWSLFIRERTLILDQGTPWLIGHTDYDVPMINIDDFCIPNVYHDIRAQRPLFDLVEISKRRKIAVSWIETAKLAVIMGRLPPISIGFPQGSSSSFERPLLQSGVSHIHQSFNDIAMSLEKWQKDIAPEIDFAQLDSPASWVGDCQLYIHYATLRLLYHTVKFHLAVLSVLPNTQETHQPNKMAHQTVRDNCTIITQLISKLQAYGCSIHVPLYGTSVLRPVLIWAILNDIPDQNVRQISIYDPLQFEIGRRDTYLSLFKAFLSCDDG